MIFEYELGNIHYQIQGDGPFILLLHGFLEDHLIWEEIHPLLSDRFTLVMPDLPGHGKSAVLSETQSMSEMGEAIQALLDHLGIDQYDLMGHSMGGYVGLAMLEQKPEKVNRFFLLNSTPEADSEQRKKNRNRGIQLMDQNPGLFISTLIRQLFDPKTANKYEDQILELIQRANGYPTEGVKACMRGMRDRPDRLKVFKGFGGAKTIIHGMRDPIMPKERIKAVARQTNCQLISLEGGHMSWLEKGDEIVKMM